MFDDDVPGDRVTLTTKDDRTVGVAKRVGASSAGLVLSALVLSTACGAPDVDLPVGEARCQQFESFAGQLHVGDPSSGLPTVPGLVPVEPGDQALPPPVLPTLDSIEIDRTPDGDTVVFGLGGDGSIGWTARFVQMPLLHGTDDPVPISGACILQVDLTGVDSNIASLRREVPMRLSTEDEASSVVEILGYPSSSGLVQSFVGTRSGTPTVSVESSIDRPAITVAISH